VSTGAAIKGATAAADAERDWEAVRASADIQFAPVVFKPPPVGEPPQWLVALIKWLRELLEPLGRALGLSWPVLEKVLIVLIILGVLFISWRLLAPLFGQRRKAASEPEPEWTPGRAAAVALLEDADRLAAEGRFGEAAHLLLQRSVHHLAQARPDWLLPATTAREIARLPSLPERARTAFGIIAVRVERSLFALRELDADDWQAARAAYADFALQRFAG
jgi:hypothetical protein